MARPTVFVARRIPEAGLRRLADQCQVRLHRGSLPATRDELLAGVANCDAILSLLSDRIDAEVLDTAGPQLKVVSNYAVGVNNICLADAAARGVAVGNTPDVLTDATADIAVALLLSVSRRLPEGSDAVRSGDWKTWEPLGWIGLDLLGKTIGIVGMGRIGHAVARRLHGGWGMRVLYTSRETKPTADTELSAEHVGLDELLRSSDFVSLHVPLSDETRYLIGTRELGLMKKTAVLVNTARGEIVDQPALVESLRGKKIFGAGLDVCTPEPLPIDSPLLQLRNCLIVPHIGSATVTARNAMAERAALNVLAGVQGKPLPYPVVLPDGPKPDGPRPAHSTPGRGAVAIIVENERFLVIRRSATVRAPNQLCFAGGTIEPGETPEQTIVRELKEELNLDAVAREQVWQSKTAWGTVLDWVLVEREPDSHPQANPDEVAQWMWMAASDLLAHQDILPSVPAFFAAWACGEFTLPPHTGTPDPSWRNL